MTRFLTCLLATQCKKRKNSVKLTVNCTWKKRAQRWSVNWKPLSNLWILVFIHLNTVQATAKSVWMQAWMQKKRSVYQVSSLNTSAHYFVKAADHSVGFACQAKQKTYEKLTI